MGAQRCTSRTQGRSSGHDVVDEDDSCGSRALGHLDSWTDAKLRGCEVESFPASTSHLTG